jgi:hypothetical protein
METVGLIKLSLPRRGKMLIAPDEIWGMNMKNVFEPRRSSMFMKIYL